MKKSQLSHATLPILVAPMVFIASVDLLRIQFFRSETIAISGGTAITLLLLALIVWWSVRVKNNQFLTLSHNLVEGVKRTSKVLALIFSIPMATYLVAAVFILPKYTPFITYIILMFGMTALIYIAISTLVRAIFWCIDGFNSQTPQQSNREQ